MFINMFSYVSESSLNPSPDTHNVLCICSAETNPQTLVAKLGK